MANQSIKNVDRYLGSPSSSSVSGAVNAAKEVLSSVESAIDSTTAAIKSEVDEISKAGGKLVERTRAEFVRQPLMYTLAAAGTGLLLGAAIVAVFGHPKK